MMHFQYNSQFSSKQQRSPYETNSSAAQMYFEKLHDLFSKNPFDLSEKKDIHLVLGAKGAGKSTLINKMLGHTFEATSNTLYPEYKVKSIPNNERPFAEIGTDAVTSCTTLAKVFSKNEMNFCECPDLSQALDDETKILLASSVQSVVEKNTILSLILVIDVPSLEAGTGRGFTELAKTLGSVIKAPDPVKDSIIVVFTKLRGVRLNDKTIVNRFVNLSDSFARNAGNDPSRQDEAKLVKKTCDIIKYAVEKKRWMMADNFDNENHSDAEGLLTIVQGLKKANNSADLNFNELPVKENLDKFVKSFLNAVQKDIQQLGIFSARDLIQEAHNNQAKYDAAVKDQHAEAKKQLKENHQRYQQTNNLLTQDFNKDLTLLKQQAVECLSEIWSISVALKAYTLINLNNKELQTENQKLIESLSKINEGVKELYKKKTGAASKNDATHQSKQADTLVQSQHERSAQNSNHIRNHDRLADKEREAREYFTALNQSMPIYDALNKLSRHLKILAVESLGVNIEKLRLATDSYNRNESVHSEFRISTDSAKGLGQETEVTSEKSADSAWAGWNEIEELLKMYSSKTEDFLQRLRKIIISARGENTEPNQIRSEQHEKKHIKLISATQLTAELTAGLSGSALTEQDIAGNNALHIILKFCADKVKLLELIFKENSGNMIYLHQALNQKNHSGKLPIHVALDFGSNLEVFKFLHAKSLTDSEIKLNCIADSGYTLLHLAVIRNDKPVLAWLLSLQLDLEIVDKKCNKGQTALDLAIYRGNIENSELLLFCGGAKTISPSSVKQLKENTDSSIKKISEHIATINEYQNHAIGSIENLVFAGGGVKGYAYLSALKALIEKEAAILTGVRRVAGTSAGSITAALLAVGYTIEELTEIFTELDFTKFLDENREGTERIFQMVKADQARTTLNGMQLAWNVSKLNSSINKDKGWFKGEFFLKWIEGLIKAKLGEDNVTFLELAKKHAKNPRMYKLLYAMSTNFSTQKPHLFSHETTPYVVISHAIRASMSIPFVFSPFKVSVKPPASVVLEKDNTIFVDGGLLNNYPIELFDTKRYCADDARFNSKTRGILVCTEEQRGQYSNPYYETASAQSATVQGSSTEYGGAIVGIVYDAEYATKFIVAENVRRTSFIATNTSTLDFKLSEDQRKKMSEAGAKAVEQFFSVNRTDNIDIVEGKAKTFKK